MRKLRQPAFDPADVALQRDSARQLKEAGFVPVPHIPARFIRDLDDLKARLGHLAEAGVSEMLALGGGAPQPIGRYDAAITNDDNRRHWAAADHLSANSANSAAVRRTLRARARYEVANNSYARGIVLTLALMYCIR